MVRKCVHWVNRMAAASLLTLLTLPAVSVAEGQAVDPEVEIEEVVVVGTRALPRSVQDSPVPVDTISSEQFANQGSSDTSNLIRTLVPSFHVSDNPSRDLAALLRPVQLRGLAPDHTLILMNNKRRHRGSVIQWISNGASNGSQGPDISAIPTIAVKRMEVLRDGAAAQYGSDAIAGVLNFVLKNASEGVTFEAKHGAYTADSDENLTTIATNIGLPLADDGFANLSFEYADSAPTDRSVQHGHASELIALGIPNVAAPAKPWGSPDVRGIKAAGNFGVDLDENRSVYAFGNFARRTVETPFFYRSPMNRDGVYRTGPLDNKKYLVGGEGCQARYNVASTAENLLDFRAKLRADNGCYSFVEDYPEGFTPTFGAVMTDYSAVAGLKGSLSYGLLYDISTSIGANNMDGFLKDTLNPSLGPNSPRDFDFGEYTQTERNFNVDLAYPVDVGLASDLNVAGGLEWREEEFTITTGEPASWEVGPYEDYGFGIGSNGFGGFNPTNAGTWNRANIATYLDLEVEPTDSWRIGGAVRWEDFDSFGSTTNVKLATGVWVTDVFALRGSVGTGFRAPTPGQSNARNVSTVVNAQTNEFEERGTIGSTHPVAMALGGRELQPEESENVSLGVVLALDNGLSLTVDYFRIDVDDRIALSRLFDVTDEIKAELVAAGIPEARDFTSVRYFTNDFDTRTQGLDVVLTYGWETGLGDTDLQLSFNHTDTEVIYYRPGSTIGDDIDNLERGVPETRVNLTLTHSMDQWDFLGRYSYYGDWYDDHSAADFDGYGLVDVQAKYNFLSGLAISVGAENVLDEYPDLTINYGNGRKYPRYAPGGYNGALVYAKLSYSM